MRIARNRSRDLFGILLITSGAITLLGLASLTSGGLLDLWIGLLESWLGWGAVVIPLTTLATGIMVMDGRKRDFRWSRVLALELVLFAALGLLSGLLANGLPQAEIGEGGGIVGWSIARAFGSLFGKLGRLPVLFMLAATGVYWVLRRRAQEIVQAESLKEPANERPPDLPQQYRKRFKIEDPSPTPDLRPRSRHPDLPPMEILEKGETRRVTAREINRSAGIIEKTLNEFRLPAKVVDYRAGPSVTQFAVEPGYIEHTSPGGSVSRNKVRVSQIQALANDLALALSASAIRIEAPVPGKAYVGIEVPNQEAAVVAIRPILESANFQNERSRLAIALGRDVAGEPVVADLASMPHLLIAGTTGSGKSVCITSIAMSLAMNNSPDELQFIMIDPKRVELLRFNGLPHLMGKVEADLARIPGVLRWCTEEMDRRFRLLEHESAKDLTAYNRKVARRKKPSTLPRLVVMIDELSDLMMLAPDQTEGALVRLAQMGRATGIHLVVATQRPSTDVVTGLIKANFPARIAFAVASAVDSRVILDGSGAESLLGRGDMLYLAPDAAGPVRLQGAYTSDKELEKLIRTWRQKDLGPGTVSPWEDYLVRQEAMSEQDADLDAAIELVRQTGKASASLLQRKLRVGYPRAARLMDELEELGIVGRAQGGGRAREVLISDSDG
ncbi:MAG: DNA translocase FtsK [Chloroflexi bacterium]|nr:DNA translocase FtsK [Chloroflexota bacterium]MDK1044576.1 DNA translocase FtsK [Anaerolineales bacterium]MCI0805218.1 DNA translocase FtsK [Chloroflexota bacterium]MCI0826523.1 DNA translocase FtsK [Chloroflexota bacterium]MCI0853031.1 DNA translocase FtsK [Chloroflexota bacterium]